MKKRLRCKLNFCIFVLVNNNEERQRILSKSHSLSKMLIWQVCDWRRVEKVWTSRQPRLLEPSAIDFIWEVRDYSINIYLPLIALFIEPPLTHFSWLQELSRGREKMWQILDLPLSKHRQHPSLYTSNQTSRMLRTLQRWKPDILEKPNTFKEWVDMREDLQITWVIEFKDWLNFHHVWIHQLLNYLHLHQNHCRLKHHQQYFWIKI